VRGRVLSGRVVMGSSRRRDANSQLDSFFGRADATSRERGIRNATFDTSHCVIKPNDSIRGQWRIEDSRIHSWCHSDIFSSRLVQRTHTGVSIVRSTD